MRRQGEQLRDPPAREAPAGLAERQAHGSRERELGLGDHRSQLGRGDRRRGDAHRQADRRAAEAGERADDRRLGGGASSARPVRAGTSTGRRPRSSIAASRGLCATAGREPLHVVPERGVVDAHRRRDVGAEDARLEPAVAAERAEAVALATRGLDRGRPVDGEAELARRQPPRAVAGREDDGCRGDGGRAALELGLRLRRRHPETSTPAIATPSAIARPSRRTRARARRPRDGEARRRPRRDAPQGRGGGGGGGFGGRTSSPRRALLRAS